MANSLVNCEHRFDCLSLKLKTVPLAQADRIDLILSIFFGEHEEELHFGSGKAKFAIRSGSLNLELEGGVIASLEDFKLKNDFKTVLEIEVNEEIAVEQQGGLQLEPTKYSLTRGIKGGEKLSAKQVINEYQVRIAALLRSNVLSKCRNSFKFKVVK